MTPIPMPTAAVFTAAPPPVLCAGTLVDAGIDVVSTTVPDVVTTTDPDADANDDATDCRTWLADSVTYATAVKLQRVKTS
jgi:hypothetical protein